MKRFSGFVIGAMLSGMFTSLCFGFGLMHEIAIGRRSAIPGITREIAAAVDKADLLGLGKLGWQVAKGLHYLITNVLGIGSSCALETPLSIGAFTFVALSSVLGGLMGKHLLSQHLLTSD